MAIGIGIGRRKILRCNERLKIALVKKIMKQELECAYKAHHLDDLDTDDSIDAEDAVDKFTRILKNI